MAHRLDIVENISINDMSIAQRLLNRPRIPTRGTSIMYDGAGCSSHSKTTSEINGALESSLGNDGGDDWRQRNRTSNTWTSSSGELINGRDDVEDRGAYIEEYNRLAKKHGVRQLAADDLDTDNVEEYNTGKRNSWFSRNVLRRTSSTQSIKQDKRAKHRRSISDLSIRLKSKRDILRDKDLQELARLCGVSRLYLPAEYATGSLAIPTCFRATAQYLVQHAPIARGVFRIPGSHGIIVELYTYYSSQDEDGEGVSGTVRCPTLPAHIKCDVHDVASVFKRFLSGLPGGILGSLPLFYALVSIQSQLNGDAELTRTKQSKVRARLIALAVWTLKSHHRRGLICAVFGLLSMVGRGAETARREDDKGRPLPTSDLMGYGALGIIFGPLLLGDTLEHYEMRLANPYGSLILLPGSPPKSKREKKKDRGKSKSSEEPLILNTHIDKIKVANGVAEMLITHWRDVVRHMRNMKFVKDSAEVTKHSYLRPSASESFALRKPPDWDEQRTTNPIDPSASPTPASRNEVDHDKRLSHQPSSQFSDSLVVKKQRSRPRPVSSQKLSTSKSLSFLAPTIEEQHPDHIDLHSKGIPTLENDVQALGFRKSTTRIGSKVIVKSPDEMLLTEKSKSPLNQSSNQATSKEPEKAPAISPRRISVSEPDYRPFGLPQHDGKQSSGDIRPRHSPPTADSVQLSPKSTRTQNTNTRAVINQTLSLTDSTNFSQKLRIWESVISKDKSGDPARGSARKRTSIVELSRNSPLRLFKSFGTPKKRSPEESSSANSSKHQSKPKRSIDPESRHSENIVGSPKISPSKTPRKYSTQNSPAHNSPRISVRALAARFNTVDSRHPFNWDSKTPTKTKNTLEEFDQPADSSKEKVIAPYTSNPPSPTKSYRSGKTDKSVRSQLTLKDSLPATPTRPPAPRKLVKKSLVDDTPLRSVRNSVEEISQRAAGVSNNQHMDKPIATNPSTRNISLPRSSPQKDDFPMSDEPPKRDESSRTDKSPKRDESPKRYESSKRDDSLARDSYVTKPSEGPRRSYSSAYLASARAARAVSNNTQHSVHHQHQTAALGGVSPTEALNRPPIKSPFNETLSSPFHQAHSPVPSRSNSILHGQIRTLQRQLEAKTDEIRQLKQQIDNRGHLDIGTLSEQLRAAKRDAHTWKSRAEVAEKQIEVMEKLSQGNRASGSSTRRGHSHKHTAIHTEEVTHERTRKYKHAMDGAQDGRSGESNDCILYDNAVISSEYEGHAKEAVLELGSHGLFDLYQSSPKSGG